MSSEPASMNPIPTLSNSARFASLFKWSSNPIHSSIYIGSDLAQSDSIQSETEMGNDTFSLPRSSARSSRSSEPGTGFLQDEVLSLKRELRLVSADLAASIGREMNLEEEIDQLHGNRSGKEISEGSTNAESKTLSDLEKQLRKIVREKAEIRMELTQACEQERSLRQIAEDKLHQLEAKMPSVEAAANAQALSDDLRRKWLEERQAKENLEDLIHGMREEKMSAKAEGNREMMQRVQTLERENEQLQAAQVCSTNDTRYVYTTEEQKGDMALLEIIKEIEQQRDALQLALRRLKDKYDVESKRYQTKLRALEARRDRDRERLTALSFFSQQSEGNAFMPLTPKAPYSSFPATPRTLSATRSPGASFLPSTVSSSPQTLGRTFAFNIDSP